VTRRRGTFRAGALLAASLALSSCESVARLTEVAAPTALAIGNAILSAAAANYSGEYSTHVQALVASFSQSSQVALNSFLNQRKQQRLLAAEIQAQADAAAAAPPPPPPPDEALPPPPEAQTAATTTTPAEPPPPPAPESAAVAAPAAPAISLDVAMLKRSGERAEDVAPLGDGTAMRGDPAGQGDRFRVFFRPNVPSFVYVVAVDPTGWVQPIFPASFGPELAPVSPDATTLLPGDAHWFAVDDNRGVFHVFFMASLERRPDVEQKLQDFLARTRELPPAPASVVTPVVVEESWVAERGTNMVHRGVPELVTTRDGSFEVAPDTFSFGVAGADLVLTRWFRVE
jgi:hypothetical protein